MTGALAPQTQPLRRPERRPERPPLRAVPPRTATRQRPRLVYAVATIGLVGAIVVVQLLLSVALSQGAYELSSLRSQQRDLGYEQASLTEQLDTLRSPQNVASAAESAGMLINQSPAYLTLSDGSVLGTAGPGGAATELPLAEGLVGNALLDALTAAVAGATADDAAGDDASETDSAGASSDDEAEAPVTFENGLPSPDTH